MKFTGVRELAADVNVQMQDDTRDDARDGDKDGEEGQKSEQEPSSEPSSLVPRREGTSPSQRTSREPEPSPRALQHRLSREWRRSRELPPSPERVEALSAQERRLQRISKEHGQASAMPTPVAIVYSTAKLAALRERLAVERLGLEESRLQTTASDATRAIDHVQEIRDDADGHADGLPWARSTPRMQAVCGDRPNA